MFKKVLLSVLLVLGLVIPSEALTRKEFPGGTYSDARTDGSYAVLMPHSSVLTQEGSLPLPPAELAANGIGPLYIRVTESGPFKFAGQSHAGLGTWEWSQFGWHLLGPACGVSPVIYDLSNVLHISDCSVGSQGWRYIDEITGKLVTGDATYADKDNKIWEYTRHGNVTVGQGEKGCIAIRGADRRMLEVGDCRFVRFNRSGDQLSIAMVKLTENKSVIIWLTESELSTFPLETVDPPPPPVKEICGDKIDNNGDGRIDENCPVDPPVTEGMPDHKQLLIDLRKNYPALLNQQQAGELMARLAYTLRAEGFGLYKKNGGNNCPIPNSSVMVSCDIILHKPTSTWCDVLGSGPDVGELGPSTPTWCKGDPGDMTNFFSPPNPGAVDPPPPPPTDDLQAKLDAANLRIADLTKWFKEQSDHIGQLEQELEAESNHVLDEAEARQQALIQRDAARAELAALKAQPEPTCEAKIYGIKIGCKIIRK